MYGVQLILVSCDNLVSVEGVNPAVASALSFFPKKSQGLIPEEDVTSKCQYLKSSVNR